MHFVVLFLAEFNQSVIMFFSDEVNDTVEGVMIGMELGLGHHGGSLHPHNMPQHQMHSQGLMHQTQQQMHHDDGK